MGLRRSCVILIVLAGKERFAFKGVASNLVTYLTDVVKMRNSSAAKTVNSWGGFTSMLPLLLAPLADTYWDRYSTILAFSFIYVVGLVALTSTAFTWAWSSSTSSNFLFWSLCLISIGQAGYNPSLQAFGTDQLDSDEGILPTTQQQQEVDGDQNHKSSNKNSSFFKWWYFGVCTGSLLGVTVMSYIQDTFGWVLGFAIPTIAMVTSTAFLSMGTQNFKLKADETVKAKPLMNVVRAIIRTAATKLIKNRKIVLPSSEESDAMELELQEEPLCCDQNSGSSRRTELLLDDDLNPNKNGNHLVVLRLLPIWTMLLMFAVIFQQPATFFTKQGMTMERNMGSNFKIPPAMLQSAITISIILLMPIYDTILIRAIRVIIRCEKGITVMQRMGIGMFLSIVAMVIAAIVETKRLELNQRHHSGTVVPISIFWLLPQYILLGISDIFTVVGMQEFFYKEVPIGMRTMAFALYTSVFGVGSFLSALLISVIEVLTSSRNGHSWFSDDMREARLDLYYWVLAFASALSLLLYVVLCKFFKSRSDLGNETCK